MTNNEFQTIDHAQLDTVSGGGGRGEIIKKAAGWAWRNVIAPMGGGAIYDWATGGGRQQQPPQPQQPPAQPQQQPPRT
jgi:COMC family